MLRYWKLISLVAVSLGGIAIFLFYLPKIGSETIPYIRTVIWPAGPVPTNKEAEEAALREVARERELAHKREKTQQQEETEKAARREARQRELEREEALQKELAEAEARKRSKQAEVRRPPSYRVLSIEGGSWFPRGARTIMEIGTEEVVLDPHRHTRVFVQEGTVLVRRNTDVSEYSSGQRYAPHSTSGFGIISVSARIGRATIVVEVASGPPLYQSDYDLGRLQ
jgi:multidrug efflux pump subunit AcrA (membrane-fusion protein)